MYKILFFLINILFWLNFVFADLNIKTNIESWEYNFPIEINLISNQKDAKIFYYTDWEWRIDNIKQYLKPILLRENTTLDYYATNKDHQDTLIKTSIYTFKYSNKIDIIWKNNKIIIKNNSWKIQNIWYWKIECNNLGYEINPNIFLENKEIFEIDYIPEENEKLLLFSPDKKIIKTNIYKRKIDTKKEIIIENWKTETSSWETLSSETWSELETSSWEILKSVTWSKLETPSWEILFSWSWNLEIENLKNVDTWTSSINKDFKITENLQSSIVNSNNQKNNNSFYIILYLFAFIIFSMTFYNIYTVIKTIKDSKKK